MSASNQAGEERKVWPKTLDEAAKQLISTMPECDRVTIKKMDKNELFQLHFGWGMYIRDRFGLWQGNETLMQDCKASHPDDASMVIIEAVCVRLQDEEVGYV